MNFRGLPIGGPSIMIPPLWTRGDLPGHLLTEGERALLAAIATVARFKKGEIIHKEGDHDDAVFNIIAGVVRIYTDLSDHRKQIVGFRFSNDIALIAKNGYYVNSMEAVTPVTLYRIPTNFLEILLRQHAQLAFKILGKLCHDLHLAQDHVLLLGKRHAVARIGLFLQMLEARQGLSDTNNNELYLPMTRLDIGSFIGISAEAVSRSFRDLARRGAIRFRNHRHVKIVDRARLEAAIAQGEGTTGTAGNDVMRQEP